LGQLFCQPGWLCVKIRHSERKTQGFSAFPAGRDLRHLRQAGSRFGGIDVTNLIFWAKLNQVTNRLL
jgi:hypothetical protein